MPTDSERRIVEELSWEAFDPNEYCLSCGVQLENYHYNCQGHQNCFPECPACGGELAELH